MSRGWLVMAAALSGLLGLTLLVFAVVGSTEPFRASLRFVAIALVVSAVVMFFLGAPRRRRRR